MHSLSAGYPVELVVHILGKMCRRGRDSVCYVVNFLSDLVMDAKGVRQIHSKHNLRLALH